MVVRTGGSLAHIARATLPIVTDSPSGESGLSDLVLFDLIKFEKSWGRWGIGPVLLAPTATDDAIGAGKWSIGTSEMNVTYDWDRDAWTVLPLGVKLARLVKFGKLPVQFAGGYEYNFADDYVAPEWMLNFAVKVLFPILSRAISDNGIGADAGPGAGNGAPTASQGKAGGGRWRRSQCVQSWEHLPMT